MKKTVIAIALAMMSIFLVGCYQPLEPDQGVAQKIIGQWITAESDGKPLPTNEKVVLDFVSATEAYVSLSFQDNKRKGTPWNDRQKAVVEIIGNDVTLTNSPEPGTTVIVGLHVEVLTNSAMVAKRTVTIRKDGGLVKSDEDIVRCEKLDVDYSTKVVGLWQGKMTSEESAYDDGQEHRWEFLDDGTFVYFVQNEKGIWEPGDDTLNEYFVAGNLLCTRWVENGTEYREWWEIATASDKSMIWIGLREKEDGSRYNAAFSMEKVSVPTQAEIEKAIIGKWITAETDGKDIPTNEKIVFDIVSPTEAFVSLSIQDRNAEGTPWSDREAVNIEINGNDVILSHSAESGMVITVDLQIEAISDATLIARRTVTMRQDGGLVKSEENMVLYEKMDVDYSEAICGMWEGRKVSGGTTEYHRWEYFEDGSFNFYIKVGEDQWTKVQDDYSDYFVEGRLLCTRWKNAGEGTQENREWWEIRSIENDAMIWTALRQNEQGEEYVESFVMTRVEP